MPTVQWFPGHMARSERLIKESLKRVDLVIEVLDARAPAASHNPLLRKLISSQSRLVVLNKNDLADPAATKLWLARFQENDHTLPTAVSATRAQGLDSIPRICDRMCQGARWRNRRAIRALIIGIPNVGKSTLINALSGVIRAKTGAAPGLTRDIRRIPITEYLEIFDSPGMLWHKFESTLTGLKLAALGAIKESIVPGEELAGEFLSYMARCYRALLMSRYNLDDVPQTPHELVERVGRKRGCLLTGGKIDYTRTSQMVLKDLREGRFGQLSLEWPDGRGWRDEQE